MTAMSPRVKVALGVLLGTAVLVAILAMQGPPAPPRDYDFVKRFPHKGHDMAWEVGREDLVYEFQAPTDKVREAIRQELAAKGWTRSTRMEWHGEGKPKVEVDDYRSGSFFALFLPFSNSGVPPPGTTCEIIISSEPSQTRYKTTGLRRSLKKLWPFGPRQDPEFPTITPLP